MKFGIRNVIAVLLVFALIFGILPAGNYAYGTYPGADKLKEFGFIKGGTDGDLMVERLLKRSEACVLLAEIHGEIEAAKNFKGAGPNKFSDVSDGDWFAPYVRYANSRGWVNGYSDGLFRPNDYVSVQMWAKMLLEALGYYDSWSTSVADLGRLGVKVYAVNSLEIKRGEAFDALWAAVNKTPKGETRSLGEILGKLKPKQADIVKVDIPSLINVDIFVSEDLNAAAAQDSANYMFLEDGKTELKIKSVAYNSSEKKISVVFESALKTGSTLTLERVNVGMVGEGALEKSGFGEITVQDNVPPSVISMTSLGTRAIKIVFSEPVYSRNGELVRGDFVFDKPVNVKSVKLMENGSVAIIELNTAFKGALSVQPQKSIRDLYGHVLITDKQVVNMAVDTTQLTVDSVISVSPVEVVFKLSKGMSSVRSDASMFMSGNNRISDGGAELDGDILKIKFTKNYMPVGRTTITVKAGAMTDYSGSPSSAFNYDVVVPSDSETPYAQNGVVAEKQNQLKIKFNEPLKTTGTKLLARSNYKLTFFENGEVNKSNIISSVNYDSANYTIVINTSENMLGDYRLEIGELFDLSGNDGSTFFDFAVGDVMPPNSAKWSAKIYDQGKARQVVRIKFDEPMMLEGKNGVLDPENIMFGKVAFDKLDASRLELKPNLSGDELEIIYPGKIAGGMDFTLNELGSMNLLIARVADAAGNLTESIVNTVVVTQPNGMRISQAELVASDLVKLTINDEAFDIDHTDIVIEAAGKRVFGELSAEVEGGNTSIFIRFSSSLASPVTVRTVAGNSVNKYGEKFANTAAVNVTDKIGPTVETVNGNENVYYDAAKRTIVIVFSELIDPRVVSLLSFEVPGIGIENITVSGKEVRMVVAAADKDKVMVDQLVLQKQEIRDLQGNGTLDIVTSVKNIK